MVLCGDAIGHVVGGDVDTGFFIHSSDLPGHCHRAGVRGIVRDEVHLLHDPHAGDDVDEASLDDVGVRRGLAR